MQAAHYASVDRSSPSVAQSASDVSSALTPHTAELSAEIYRLIVREIPPLTGDHRILTLLEASVRENVTTLLHVLQHGIDLENVRAPAAAQENWLRNLSAARAARVRVLLSGERVDVASSEAILGYRLRQHHVGAVCWAGEAEAGGGTLTRLEQATAEVARRAGCKGRPIFLPQDESSAWAWLPLGARQTFAIPAADPRPGGAETGVRLAVGAAAPGLAGFRRTHQQALGAYAVALAAGPSARFMTCFSDIAPLALMSGSIALVRAWVIEILGALADDDDQHSTLRDTLRVFLHENGSFKATAERLTLHKNTVQYRIRKAERSLGHPVGENRLHVELALLATQWLGGAVLRQPGTPGHDG